MDSIPLSALLPDTFDPADCKLHCAVWNGQSHPIDALATSWENWTQWNRWRGTNNDFNRPLVFSVARDRNESSLWLFGGIWEVLVRNPEPRAHSYEVTLREDLMGVFIRRLRLRFALTGRATRLSMEKHVDRISVHSILDDPYAGEAFPGHDQINHTLAELAVVVKQQQPDWKIALQHMKGVYVLHDRTTGEPYVGAAYGDTGVWSRLCEYTESLHGENAGLKELVAERGEDHVRENLSFALLEFWAWRTEDEHVLNREKYWKEVLLSREKHGGWNRN